MTIGIYSSLEATEEVELDLTTTLGHKLPPRRMEDGYGGKPDIVTVP